MNIGNQITAERNALGWSQYKLIEELSNIRYLITYLARTSVLKKKTRHGALVLHICARIMDVPDTTVQ